MLQRLVEPPRSMPMKVTLSGAGATCGLANTAGEASDILVEVLKILWPEKVQSE